MNLIKLQTSAFLQFCLYVAKHSLFIKKNMKFRNDTTTGGIENVHFSLPPSKMRVIMIIYSVFIAGAFKKDVQTRKKLFQLERAKILSCFWQFSFFQDSEMPGIFGIILFTGSNQTLPFTTSIWK